MKEVKEKSEEKNKEVNLPFLFPMIKIKFQNKLCQTEEI